MDHLGVVNAIDHLGQSVVVAVAHTSDGGLDPGFGEALSVLDGYVLGSTVAMVDETAPMGRSAIMKRLFQGIQDEAGMRGPAGSPADNPSGVGVDDEGHVDEPCPGRDVGEVRTHSMFGAGA